MTKKKKMEKIDLSTFFKSANEDTGFKVFTESDKDEKEEMIKNLPANAQKLLVRKEKKGRGGKTVTIIEGYKGNPQVLNDLCKKLKQHCGVGGNTKAKYIILQGDIADKVVIFLLNNGYNAKKTTM